MRRVGNVAWRASKPQHSTISFRLRVGPNQTSLYEHILAQYLKWHFA